MIVFYRWLFATAFVVCCLWLDSVTVISGNIAVKSFRETGALWLDSLLYLTPFLCIAFAVFAIVGRFRPLLLSIALVMFAVCGIWLSTMQSSGKEPAPTFDRTR
jgi:hypothetical protein